jgi:type IV secretion system protein TrbI
VNDAVIPPTAAPAKVDPETLVLRGSPARVTRFRRGVIILIAGVSATAVAGAAWLALKPVNLRMVMAEEDRSAAAAKVPSDALADAPSSYGEVPQLGPPLPGDLGRPILNHQRGIDVEGAAQGPDLAAQAAETERQRLVAQQRAARESGIMMQLAGSSRSSGGASKPSDTGQDALDAEMAGRSSLSEQETIGEANQNDINPYRLAEPTPWTLHAGSIIAASLITGLNSDLPGLVTAQVTENVCDSVTGQAVLIPQGSRLIGRYDSRVLFGQSRALVVWQRIILPDGSSIRIDDVPATDTEGYAGLSDGIDRHSWQLLKGVALSTLLGVGTELGWGSSESDLVRAVREAAQQSGARAGDQLIMRQLDVKPTLRVRPGWPLRVVVHKDIMLRPWVSSAR